MLLSTLKLSRMLEKNMAFYEFHESVSDALEESVIQAN